MNGPKSFKTEDELLKVLTEYIRENKIKVESPNYLETGLYSFQWKCLGSLYYYRLPNAGKVIALRDGDTESYLFDPNGFKIKGI